MTKFLLTVDYNGGVVTAPMAEWAPADIKAHLDYYQALNEELAESGELIEANALTGLELAKVVTSDGVSTRVITDGPFVESKELLAGYELVDVDSEERAIEIAAKFSCVPGPDGVPLQQPIGVRRLLAESDLELRSPEL